jgi:hypothetical protein
MIALATVSPIVSSNKFGLAIGGLAMFLLCAAQLIEPTARRTWALRVVSVVAALLCVVVAVLVVARFSAFSG